MENARIALSRNGSGPHPQEWSSASQLRIGRLPDQDIILDDISVSRRHAEVVLADEGWVVRDLGSSNGTHLNGARVFRTAQRLRQGDLLQVGEITLRVDSLRGRRTVVPVGSGVVAVEAVARRSWDEAVNAFGPTASQTRDAASLLPMMRTGYRLSHTNNPDAELQKLLDEAITVFGAQRGGILFVEPPESTPVIRCVSVSSTFPTSAATVSKTPAALAIRRGQSLLFHTAEMMDLRRTESLSLGSVASVICAVLRSPEQVFGVLHLDRGPLQQPFSEEDLFLADSLAAALAAGIERVQMVERQQELLTQTVTALAHAIEMRDRYTGDHTHRVTTYSLLLAEEMNVPSEQRRLLRASAALHDIGKIAIDDEILRKPGRLSADEMVRMKRHVVLGAEILQTVPGLSWALPVVRSHHERWDGRGYPDGLKGEAIPLVARVVGVADAFDAMTSDRPYRKGLPVDVAFEELQRGSGTQFDPRCIAAFVRIRSKIETVLKNEASYLAENTSSTKTLTAEALAAELSDTSFPDPSTIPAQSVSVLR